MKAISLWQPWASGIILDIKRFETRGWNTTHRGSLVIHAAKRAERVFQLDADILSSGEDPLALPCGALIGVVNLENVWPTEMARSLREVSYRELRWGDYTTGRFAWELDNLRRFRVPVPWRGAQGLFNVPDEIVAKALAA